MRIASQLLIAAVLLVAALAIWIAFVPAALPLLDRIGVLSLIGKDADQTADASAAPPGQAGGPTTVRAVPAVIARINDAVETIGDGQPLISVTVLPEVTGVLETVPVQSGSYVEKGTVIATLRNEVEIIARDRALLMLEDARQTLERVERLGSSVSDIQRIEARLTLQTAELELRAAELELARREIRAPIAGWVGILAVEPGDQVSPSVTLAQIDDRSRLVVDFRVPERFVAQIGVGNPVQATPLARPNLQAAGRISAIDSRVDLESRTLRVQAEIENDDDQLRAGMAFSIGLSFEGEPQVAVPPLAIQWSSDGSFVWVVRDGAAQREPVEILQRNSDLVLVGGALAAGDLIITEGVQSLRPGAPVAPQSAEAAPALTPAALTTEG